jgi:hypothetical protein
MEGLGRVFDVEPVAAGVYLSMKNCSGVTFVCKGADTYSVTEAKTFGGGSAQAIGNVIKKYYQKAGYTGAFAWTKQTQAAAAAVVQAGAYVTVIEVFASQLDDGFDYIACSVGGSGLVTAVLHDLTVQRTPANLAILHA